MNTTSPVIDFAGRVLGEKYLVGERLGSGGYGTVYAAMQRDLGRPVAIKVLDGRVSDHDVTRFEREARAAAALGHPHIVQVTDFSARPGEPPFLVMEMLSGETLSSAIQRSGRLPAARLAAIAHQVLAALDAAHRAGIVHRDVKPANVFLVGNTGVSDFVKLLDFGIAKMGGDATVLTQSGAMLGSPAYMAPEQVKSMNVDPRTDIYALGATMYHALSGRYPFDAPTVHALLYAIAETRPTALASLDGTIDPRIVAVVERAMQKDPALRFQSATEMRAALEPVLGGVAPMMSHPPPQPAAPSPKSNVALIVALIAGAFVLLLLASGAGVVFYLRSADPDSDANASSSPRPVSSAVALPPASASSPPEASATTTSAPTTKKSASPSPSPSPPPPPKEAFAGVSPRYSGGTYPKPLTSTALRPSIDATMPAIKQCFVATEFDPPDHRNTDWAVVVDSSGVVTSATRRRMTNTLANQPHPKLDACVTTALRTMKVPPVEGGGSFNMSIHAPAKGDL